MINDNPRLTMNDSLLDIVYKMSKGNPGAASVLVQLLKDAETIDPQAFMGGLGAIMSLDTMGIYEDRIWMFYKDVCGQDLVKLIAVQRACQLGLLPLSDVNRAINGEESLDVDAILTQVKNELEEFDRVQSCLPQKT